MEKCWICGKEMVHTVGGCYHCPTCGTGVNDCVLRIPSSCDIPVPQRFGEQKGWICPVCGRGLAPWMSSCPCNSDAEITYGTSTTTCNDELNKLFELNDKRIDEMVTFVKRYDK